MRYDESERDITDERVQHAKEGIAKPQDPEQAEKVPDIVDRERRSVGNQGEESDCDASPPKSADVDVAVLVDRIGKLEDKIESLETNLKAKLDHVGYRIG